MSDWRDPKVRLANLMAIRLDFPRRKYAPEELMAEAIEEYEELCAKYKNYGDRDLDGFTKFATNAVATEPELWDCPLGLATHFFFYD